MTRAVLVGAVAAGLVAGCGDSGRTDEAPLSWAGRPYVGTPSRLLPDDRVLLGSIRNDGSRRVRVHYTDVRLLDGTGDVVPAGIRFTNASGHGLYPPTREPHSIRAAEDLRIGRAIDLAPGATAPVVLAWRGGERPVTLDYPAGQLPLPRADGDGDGAIAR